MGRFSGFRKKLSHGRLFLICLFLFTACSRQPETGADYYFDPVIGDNLNSGLTPRKALKNLSQIKQLRIGPGDRILLKSGEIFDEQLYFSGKGEALHPVVIEKYGGEKLPHIRGNGRIPNAVHLYNPEHIIIRDLEISNKGDTAIQWLNGLKVELDNYGTARNITIENLYVHDVWGTLLKEKEGEGNAILITNFKSSAHDSVLSRYDGLIVQNCHVENCQRNGIMMWGNWIRGKWLPSLNIVIRHNLIEGVPGDGIVPVGCESPLVEYNVMKNCPGTLPPSEACDGIWPWSCDNAVIQYNVVSGHRSQVDGYGFDSDWNSTNSLFRYNLSYNNDGGFLLICNSGGWPVDWSIGNSGTRIRYNLSINDGIRNYIVDPGKGFFSPVIHITGPTRNTVIEKNLFYIVKKEMPAIDKTFISLTNWSGFPDSTAVNNNFLFFEEPSLTVNPALSMRNFFSENQYIGTLVAPMDGFVPYNGTFNRDFWYDKKDGNWDNLINFLKGKTISLHGKEVGVLELIGYDS